MEFVNEGFHMDEITEISKVGTSGIRNPYEI